MVGDDTKGRLIDRRVVREIPVDRKTVLGLDEGERLAALGADGKRTGQIQSNNPNK